jgi:hypothetical protein
MSKSEIKQLAEKYVSTQLKTIAKSGRPVKITAAQRKQLVQSAIPNRFSSGAMTRCLQARCPQPPCQWWACAMNCILSGQAS